MFRWTTVTTAQHAARAGDAYRRVTATIDRHPAWITRLALIAATVALLAVVLLLVIPAIIVAVVVFAILAALHAIRARLRALFSRNTGGHANGRRNVRVRPASRD